MNRQQRRTHEKKLGITKYRKTLNRSRYFEMLRRNVQEGKKKEEEMKEVRRLQDQETSDNIESNKIISEATKISEEEGITFIDAIQRAKTNLSF